MTDGCSKRYWICGLVHYEARHDAGTARRESATKLWRREWNVPLVEESNPTWRSLFGKIVRADGFQWCFGEDPCASILRRRRGSGTQP